MSALAFDFSRPSIHIPQENCAIFLDRIAAKCGDRPALVAGGHTVSYQDLAALTAAFRKRLVEAGLAGGSYLAMALALSPQQIALKLAALQLGIVVLPIYDSAPLAELRAKCAVGGVQVLAMDRSAFDRRRGDIANLNKVEMFVVDEDLAPDPAGAPAASMSAPDDLAFTPFSSGSTGEPKMVMLSHGNVLASRALFMDATGLDSTSCLVHFLPLSHVYGWMALTAALGAGAKVVLHPRYDFDRLIDDVGRHGVNSVFGVSQLITDLDRAPDSLAGRLASLRWVNTGAAPLAPAIIEGVARRLRVTVTTGYGLTEAAPVSHTAIERPNLIDVSTVGFAAANTRFRVIDPDDPDRTAMPGSSGELCVAGPQVALGYRFANGKVDRTAWMPDGSFRTGDLVEFDKAGRLLIVGRLKNIIKYKGYSVAPAELEAVLARHPSVGDCVVLGQPDREAGEIPTAFVVARGEQVPAPEELIAFVREQVSPQRSVRAVIMVDNIPRSVAGKVISTDLLAMTAAPINKEKGSGL